MAVDKPEKKAKASAEKPAKGEKKASKAAKSDTVVTKAAQKAAARKALVAKPQEGSIAKATLKQVRVSPRKARLVVDMIRGNRVEIALDVLQNCDKKTAPLVKKLILSAVANAGKNSGVDVDELYVKSAWVNEGRKLYRMIPRAQGRATPIRKRYSTITVVLDEMA